LGFFRNLFSAKPDAKPVPDCHPGRAPQEAAAAEGAPEPEMTLDPAHLPWKELSPAESQQKIAEGGVTVLDVRMPHEHAARRIAGSRLIPVQALRQRLGELDPNTTYLVHCEHGMRSTDACAILAMAGFKNLYEMAGGLASYAGPVERGPAR
jgi:rhodanese-related sulfurtransferase